jgi:putative oxygen-independent coproporphyrinogen III oxidase
MAAVEPSGRTSPPPTSDREALCFAVRPPLTLYVHLPWCVRKCPYCDFNSYRAANELPEREYVDALLRDLDVELAFVEGRSLESIFIGGGTPSLFSGPAVSRLVAGIRASTSLAPGAEITLEANPGAVEAARFAEFREAGVNRLSIGAQSFRGPKLAELGRVHGAAEIVRAFELARRAGFANINLDLMYGLPGDRVAGALADLARAIDLGAEHLSWYQLTLEPNTAFHRKPPALPGDAVVVEIEARGRELLAESGYRRYEISAYAQGSRRCMHNNNYWEFGDYLGIGAGAHGKVTLLGQRAIVRRMKPRNPRRYMLEAGQSGAVAVEHIESSHQVALEFMMNALRLVDGVAVACFESRAGQPLGNIAVPLTVARSRGWLAAEGSMLRPTAQGLQMLNSVLALFC